MLIKKFFDFIINLWRVMWGSPVIPATASPADIDNAISMVVPMQTIKRKRVEIVRVSSRRYGLLKRRGYHPSFSCYRRFVCGQ